MPRILILLPIFLAGCANAPAKNYSPVLSAGMSSVELGVVDVCGTSPRCIANYRISMDGALRIFEESEESLAYIDALEPKSPNQADALERIIGSMGILSAMYQGEESIRMKEIELLLSQDNISSLERRLLTTEMQDLFRDHLITTPRSVLKAQIDASIDFMSALVGFLKTCN